MPAHSADHEFAERIKQARSLADLSQSEAAKKWDISCRTLQGWEAGRKPSNLARKALEAILKKIERNHGR